jgi:hypothetical protein
VRTENSPHDQALVEVCHAVCVTDLDVYARHSEFSDPGRHRARLAALPNDVAALNAASRTVIGHYRAELKELPEARWPEIDSRWLERILDVDAMRHDLPLDMPRPFNDRVAGCCRDHSLFVIGALRDRAIPARSRVGFAHYFGPDWAYDHVIVEYWEAGRWVRTDPELDPAVDWPFNPEDMPSGDGAPFETAAEAWLQYVAGETDLIRYGVFPGSEFSGPDFVRDYVLRELCHRLGDELLLWDELTDVEDVNGLAALLVRADAGEADAEAELRARYESDERLRPGRTVQQHSPFGQPTVEVRLRR